MEIALFEVSLTSLMYRFYLMMAVAIVGISVGWYWLAAFAFPVFLTCLLGVKVSKKETAVAKSGRVAKAKRLAA